MVLEFGFPQYKCVSQFFGQLFGAVPDYGEPAAFLRSFRPKRRDYHMPARCHRVLQNCAVSITIVGVHEKMKHRAVMPEIPLRIRTEACNVVHYPRHTFRTIAQSNLCFGHTAIGDIQDREIREPQFEQAVDEARSSSTHIYDTGRCSKA